MFFAFEIALLERGIAFNRYLELEKEENGKTLSIGGFYNRLSPCLQNTVYHSFETVYYDE